MERAEQFERKIKREDIVVGGKTIEQLNNDLEEKKIDLNEDAKSMIRGIDLPEQKQSKTIVFERIKISDLEITGDLTTKKIFDRAKRFNLKLCSAEMGIYYRINYTAQKTGEEIYIAMEPILGVGDTGPYENIFGLGNTDGKLYLKGIAAESGAIWHPDHEFIFCAQ